MKSISSAHFSVTRLMLYFVLVTVFLFISGSVGRYLQAQYEWEREGILLVQGGVFTGLTLIFLYILYRKYPDIFQFIHLKTVHSKQRMIIGILLSFILIILGCITAYLLGGIENVHFNVSQYVMFAVLVNSVAALLFEAFPEEVFIRGLIFEELSKTCRFIVALLIQPVIFICFPVALMGMQRVIYGDPFVLTLDYIILLYVFGIALQLYRVYTGSLWMSIFFHIISGIGTLYEFPRYV